MIRWFSGIAAGAVAAVVASLASLPLDSPDDVLFNTATVTLGALAAGVACGALWRLLSERDQRTVVYAAALAATFLAIIILSFVGEDILDGLASFVVPLAAIVLVVAGILTPVLAGTTLRGPWPIASSVASLAAALAIGFALSGQSDGESGKLSLPAASAAFSSGSVSTTVLTPQDVAGAVFAVVPGESTLTYTVREKLSSLPTESDAVGRTTALQGDIRLDGQSQITVDLSTLKSDQDRRDNFVRRTIFQNHPIAQFVTTDIGALPREYTPGTTITRQVSGMMTIRGVQKPLTLQVEARLEGDTLQILGKTDFTWDYFEIPPPNTPIVTVKDNVHIEVLIIARRSA